MRTADSGQRTADSGQRTITGLAALAISCYLFVMQDYQQLEVAQMAEDVAIQTYRMTAAFPPDERFGLTQQMRRAAVSIGSNIAEGAGRLSDSDFRRFLGMATGSAGELLYQTRLAARLGLCTAEESARLVTETERVEKATTGLIRYLGVGDG